MGQERGNNLVRIQSLVKGNVSVSFHSDFAMAPMEPVKLAWTAINFVTSNKNAVSQYQRISVFDGLKGITIDAARTLSLDNKLGSIDDNKVDNFTILKENPFKIDPIKTIDIPVFGTIFKGKFNQVTQ